MMFNPQRPNGLALCWQRARVLFLLLFLAACDKAPAPEEALLGQGQVFPSYVLDFISGGSDAAGPWQGKMLVLNVWATWCPPCRREMPGLDRLSKTLDPKRFAVVGLSIDADTLLASEFLMQHGITFSNFFDQNGTMSRPLGLKVYPETFVIAPDRTLVRRMTGLHEWDSPEMISLLQGLHPSMDEARPKNAAH